MTLYPLTTFLATVGQKNLEIIEKDPHGIIMTITSVSVVFAALLILYLSYALIGKILNKDSNRQKEVRNAGKADKETALAIALALQEENSAEVQAVIALALDQHLNEYPHDEESYIITIKR